MANISTASGYAVFSAQNPETLKLLTQAADRRTTSATQQISNGRMPTATAPEPVNAFSSWGSDAGTSQTSFTPFRPISQTRTFPS